MTHESDPPSVRAYVGIGSNLGDSPALVRQAIKDLRNLTGIADFQVSQLYESEPMGPVDQPAFINAAAGFLTRDSAEALLGRLQSIESRHGRIRGGEQWGARSLDLDLLLYGGEFIQTDTLTVPHPGIAERNFVLLPLMDLDPALNIAGQGSVTELFERLAPKAHGWIRRLAQD
jgi:2-amino-4-hydroxy-6-hydroxymethyldihydropteridine diphosphokinase